MVPILVISISAFIVFIVIVVLLFRLILRVIQKTAIPVKKTAITLSSLFLLFIILGSIDVYLAGSYIYAHRGVIMDKGAEVIGGGLALTAAHFEQGWDKNLIKKFGNLEISVVKSGFSNGRKGKKYEIELMLDNHNPADDKIYFHDLIENNYLVICDRQDLVHPFGKNKINYETDKIPAGKTKASFEMIVSNDVTLEYIRFVTNRINLKP